MGLFRLWAGAKVNAELPVKVTASVRFPTPTAALLGSKSVEGALAAMTQYGQHREVALAALTTTTHAVKSLRAEFAQSSGFWVDAFQANPLLAMPETQPPFVQKALLAKPTTEAARQVAPLVARLRRGLERNPSVDPKAYVDLKSLRDAVSDGSWVGRLLRL